MATEQFRVWKPKGTIKIKYTDAEGDKNIWQKNQEELLEEIKDIVENYFEQDISLPTW